MKKLLFVLGMLLITCSLVNGQKTLRVDGKGNYYTETKSKVADKATGKSFTDALGASFPIFETATGKLYYLRASTTTGNMGKHYLKMPEVTPTVKSSSNKDFWQKPYSIKVCDEHEVRLYNGEEVIVLYMENATVLAQENEIYIDKK